jgi:hypothetical protein
MKIHDERGNLRLVPEFRATGPRVGRGRVPREGQRRTGPIERVRIDVAQLVAEGTASAEAWIRPRRLAVRARENNQIAIGIAQPYLAMVRTAGTVRRIAVRREDDLSSQLVRATDGSVEVIDLEPQRKTIPVGLGRRITDLAVMMLDVKRVQLEHEPAIAKQPFVLLPTMPALAAEKHLVEATTPRDISHRDQRLGTHGREV